MSAVTTSMSLDGLVAPEASAYDPAQKGIPMPTNWTPVALSRDIPSRVVVPVVVEGVELALWRSESGAVHAWRDRCPHRGMRLSHGFVRGEMLSCIYHGWRYDGSGRCRKIPAHPDLAPPASIAVATFSCREAGDVIFVGMGEGASAPCAPEQTMPLRSVEVAAAPDRIRAVAAVNVGEGALRWEYEGATLVLLPQPVPGGTILHALVPAGTSASGQIAASRALEALRRAVEMEVTT